MKRLRSVLPHRKGHCPCREFLEQHSRQGQCLFCGMLRNRTRFMGVVGNALPLLTYQDIGYSFDVVGNVLGYENKAAGYETNQRYTYDGLYQLIKAEGDSVGRSGAGTGLYDYETHYEQAFSFDMIGNMTEKKSRTRSPYASPPGVNLDYESQYTYKQGTHQAIQIGSARYEYDGNGNVILERYGDTGTPTGNKKTHGVHEEDGVYSTDYGFALTLGSAGSGSANTERRYVWNERNLLKRSSDGQYAVEYRYGADGQRAIKYAVKQGGSGERTETLYYNKWYQLVSTNDNLRMVESKHIYVGETRIATKQRHDDNSNYSEELKHTYYYHGDHLGSAQVVTNGSGEIYEHIEYTPYGELWVDHTKRIGSEEGTPFRFTGKEYDEETGLYYYGARYLDPKTSRWISTDPAMGEYIPGAGKGADDLPGLGGIYNTINMHTYHYAGNNPVNQTDPDGRDIEVNANDNGTYTVTGGTLNPDRNIYIMKDGERTGEVLGQTLTDFSFFGDDGVLVKDAVIDPNDNSGQAFIDDIKSNTPGLIKYAFNAGNTKKYDFKSRGGDSRGNHYRGMPIKDANGNTVYASARDVGNYGAGFVAGRNLLPWFATRVGFDFYQTISNGNLFHSWDEESINSQEAQRAGFGVGANLGIKDLNNRLSKDYNYFYHNNYGRN